MADLLQTGTEWLSGKLDSHVSKTVRYIRPAVVGEMGGFDEDVEVLATIGKTQFEEVSVEGVLYSRFESRDFLITAATLILDEEVTLPKPGDRIEETVAGVTYSYQVLPVGNEPCYVPADGYRIKWRIHTKAIQVEVVV